MYFEYAKANAENSKMYRVKADDWNFLKSGDVLKGAEVFFDPDRDLADKKRMTVSTREGSWSDDGNMWAYKIKSAGSDWSTIKVRDA